MAGEPGGLSDYERLRRLQRVADAALGHLSPDAMLGELLERIGEALESDTCAILLLDEEHNELVARAAKGIEEEVERGVRIPVGKGFAGRVAEERRPVVLDDVDHADVLNPILREKGIKSLLGVPLLARGRVLGIVHVGSLTPRQFTPEDIELLERAADRAALGLERALLHEQLLVLDTLKREFIVTAAHELRGPTAVIYGVAKTLAERRDDLDEATFRELVDTLHVSSGRLAQLTDDVLDFSRLEARALDLRVEPLRVRQLIEELSRDLSARPTEEIELEIPEQLVLVSDRSAVERILGNLISNALVHGAPPVKVRASRTDGETRITVEDHGPGISTAFAGRLFEAFARGGGAKDKPGAGLGLAIARSYAAKLGGELSYEPAEPRGATFTLVLPQVQATAL